MRVSTPKATPTNCGLCTFFLKELQIVHEEILNLPLSQQPKAIIVKPILIHLGIYTSSMITKCRELWFFFYHKQTNKLFSL